MIFFRYVTQLLTIQQKDFVLLQLLNTNRIFSICASPHPQYVMLPLLQSTTGFLSITGY